MKHIIVTVFLILLLISCSFEKEPTTVVTFDTNTIVSEGYIGNGAQWDPYQLDYGNGPMEISASDWEKLYARLDFMRPQFMRIMINTTSFLEMDMPAFEINMTNIAPILDYCQSRNVTVMFGDWGGSMVSSGTNTIIEKNIKHAALLVDFFVNEKGYSCIKYYNMINEPNGDWSATNTSYALWASAIRELHKNMQELQLTDKVSIVGPDAAIWGKEEAWWIDSCAVELGNIIQLYDIHTYPSKITVNSGEYADIISAYQKKVPKDKKIVMGEIGFKFVEESDSLYRKENIRRAQSKKYASIDDSQMYVYDYMYGTDMADALFQTVNSGYSGSIIWMLDDAMHSKEERDKLKVWGFWNILGDEYFGSEEETVRPWYYAWSLLTKYMPSGSTIYKTSVAGNSAINGMISGKDGKYMLAVVNASKKEKRIQLNSATLKTLKNAKLFLYSEGTLIKEGDHIVKPNETNRDLPLKEGVYEILPPESLVIYTTFDF